MEFTIETNDRQWTIEGPMDEETTVKRWMDGYGHNTGSLDHSIYGEDGCLYEVVMGRLEKHESEV